MKGRLLQPITPLFGICTLALLVAIVSSEEGPIASQRQLLFGRSHEYKDGDYIPVWANKVGPFSNPTETYQYYDLPFCRPSDGLKFKILGFGEVMDANRMAQTPFVVKFLTEKTDAPICTKQFTDSELVDLRNAIANDWYYQMFYDDLPFWTFVGRIEKILTPDLVVKLEIYTHLRIDVHYNNNQVIEVAVSPEKPVDITEGAPTAQNGIEFTYSVQWIPTETTFEDRLQHYKKNVLSPVHLEVQWFSIVNSCVTVLLLMLFLITILMKFIKNDFAKFAMEEEGFDSDESGWKYLHGDVFRFPPSKTLFCALIGTGSQLFFLSAFVFLLALVGTFYPHNRGSLFSALVGIYSLTAGIAGYVGCSYHRQMDGQEGWVKTVLAVCFVYCGPLFTMFCFLNTVAIVYGSTAALPFGTIVIILVIWAVVTIPLTIAGGVIGKNSRSLFSAPVRSNKYPRQVPELPWYRTTVPQMLVAGFLPFSSIYVELFYIFSTLWGHDVFIIWGILFIVFCLLLVVTAFITIALTYFQLAIEDHRWWWRSFLCGGSTGIFVYAYSIYFFIYRSDMSGFMQTSFYFGYMLMICLAFFMMLGTVGWRASLAFVRHIYTSVKGE